MKNVWIGLATVKQKKNVYILGRHVKGGFVNALALAKNSKDFSIQIKKALEELGLTMLKLEESEPFAARIANYKVEKILVTKAKEVEETGNVRFGTFDIYKE